MGLAPRWEYRERNIMNRRELKIMVFAKGMEAKVENPFCSVEELKERVKEKMNIRAFERKPRRRLSETQVLVANAAISMKMLEDNEDVFNLVMGNK